MPIKANGGLFFNAYSGDFNQWAYTYFTEGGWVFFYNDNGE